MVTRTFISKSNTIVKDLEDNFGLNPTSMLNYGHVVSRALIYFDLDKIKEQFDNKTYVNQNDVKHTLIMYNCGAIEDRTFDRYLLSNDTNRVKKRATSFDVLLIRVNKPWDEGVGFDYSTDDWFSGDSSISFDGSNWYQATNGLEWDEEGVYSEDTITKEYVKFSNGEESLVIGRQHFDHGNENLSIDVSSYINDVLSGKYENYGLMLCFTPMTEFNELKLTKYTGFFNNHTNTFFEPIIETRRNFSVSDTRYSMYLGRKGRLYLYCNMDGDFQNLDEMPTCQIDDVSYEVKQETKGIYYIECKFSRKDGYEKDTILYDTWGNIKYNGDELDDVEQEFVLNDYNLSQDYKSMKHTVTVTGINDSEKLTSEGNRMVKVIFRREYEKNEYDLINNAEYRLYVMNGNKEVDVIDWDNINTCAEYNYFMLDLETLLPQQYHIDIRAKIGNETKYFKNEKYFTIVSNSTNPKFK